MAQSAANIQDLEDQILKLKEASNDSVVEENNSLKVANEGLEKKLAELEGKQKRMTGVIQNYKTKLQQKTEDLVAMTNETNNLKLAITEAKKENERIMSEGSQQMAQSAANIQELEDRILKLK